MKKSLMIAFVISLLVTLCVFVVAADCTSHDECKNKDPSNPYCCESKCVSKPCETEASLPTGVEQRQCPNCAYQNGILTLGDATVTADLSTYTGPPDILIVDLKGGKITPPPEGISGQGTCKVTSKGQIISCDLTNGRLEGQDFTGNIHYENREIVCLSDCKIDGLTAEAGSSFIFDPKGRPTLIVKTGYVNFDGTFTGQIITECMVEPINPATNFPMCGVISPEGDYLYSPGSIEVLKQGRYLLDAGSIISKQGQYFITIKQAKVLFGHDLDCEQESGDCIGINTIKKDDPYLAYLESIGMKIKEGDLYISSRIQDAQIDLAYESTASPFRLVDYYYTSPPLSEGAKLRVVELTQGKVTGILEFTDKLNPVLIPLYMTTGVLINNPDGTFDNFPAILNEDGTVRAFSCSRCVASPNQPESALATSFFNFVGKARGFITGNEISFRRDPPPPQTPPRPRPICYDPSGILERNDDTIYDQLGGIASYFQVYYAGYGFGPEGNGENPIQSTTTPEGAHVYYQILTVEPPHTITGSVETTAGDIGNTYYVAVSVTEPGQEVPSKEYARINYFIRIKLTPEEKKKVDGMTPAERNAYLQSKVTPTIGRYTDTVTATYQTGVQIAENKRRLAHLESSSIAAINLVYIPNVDYAHLDTGNLGYQPEGVRELIAAGVTPPTQAEIDEEGRDKAWNRKIREAKERLARQNKELETSAKTKWNELGESPLGKYSNRIEAAATVKVEQTPHEINNYNLNLCCGGCKRTYDSQRARENQGYGRKGDACRNYPSCQSKCYSDYTARAVSGGFSHERASLEGVEQGWGACGLSC